MTVIKGVARVGAPLTIKAMIGATVWYVGVPTIVATIGLVPAVAVGGFVALGGVEIVTNLCIDLAS